MRKTLAVAIFGLVCLNVGEWLLMPPPHQVKAWACAAPCIQIASNSNAASGTSVDVTMGSNQTATSSNHLAIVFCASVSCDQSTVGHSITITDTGMNTYTSVQDNSSYSLTGVRLVDFVAQNVASGANVIHVSVTSGGDTFYLSAIVDEWAAAASSIDASGKGHGTSTTPSATTTGATSQNNEIVIGSYAAGNAVTEGSGYARLNHSVGPLLLSDEYKTLSATATPSADWTMMSAEWLTTIVTLKYTPAGGSVQARSILLGLP